MRVYKAKWFFNYHMLESNFDFDDDDYEEIWKSFMFNYLKLGRMFLLDLVLDFLVVSPVMFGEKSNFRCIIL